MGYVSASLYLLVPKPGRSLLYVHVSARRLKVRYAEVWVSALRVSSKHSHARLRPDRRRSNAGR